MSHEKQIFEFNGVRLEMDLLDLSFTEKYETALTHMGETEKKLAKRPEIGRSSEFIRAYCQMYMTLYDEIFGEGTSEKMFKGVYNVRLADASYAAFIKAAKSARQSYQESRDQWKYAVKPPNREHRRKNR